MTDQQASLPLSDFDHVPAGALAARVASLDIQQLEQLIGYERNHAQRRQVLDVLTRRRDQLGNEEREPESSSRDAVEPDISDARTGT